MKSFGSLDGFARHLATIAPRVDQAARHALHDGAELIAAAARESIGEYQEAAGPFPAWAPLAQSTLYGGVDERGHRFPGKVELGYAPPDNPLLREGDLRNSIGTAWQGNEAVVGSDSDVAVWQELGTSKIPARSFLGRAAYTHGHQVAEAISEAAADALAGKPYRRFKADPGRVPF